MGEGRLAYPCSRSAPVGFGPSAGWATAVTDTATARAGLPDNRRVLPGGQVPEGLLVWGPSR
eukprot:1239926-Lingulodinium_polyedra.AAC.1